MINQNLRFALKPTLLFLASMTVLWGTYKLITYSTPTIYEDISISSEIVIDPAHNASVKRILEIFKADQRPSSTSEADTIYQDGQLQFYFRNLSKNDWIRAPDRWCFGNTPQGLDKTISDCFKRVPIPDAKREPIAKALRIIRDTFREAGVKLVMTYGALLGSLRYHTQMPFDSDYDFAIKNSDWKKVLRIFDNLSLNSSNHMRVVDFRKVTGCVQIGLACENNDKWRDPEILRQYPSLIALHRGILQVLDWTAYRDVMEDCTVYIDLYGLPNFDLHFDSFRYNAVVPYRPLEGTLFATIDHAKEYLSKLYNADVDVCVPKDCYLLNGYFHCIPEYCKSLKVPCITLDGIYPRNLVFTVPNCYYTFEAGLSTNKNECWIRSIFAYKKLSHKFD